MDGLGNRAVAAGEVGLICSMKGTIVFHCSLVGVVAAIRTMRNVRAPELQTAKFPDFQTHESLITCVCFDLSCA